MLGFYALALAVAGALIAGPLLLDPAQWRAQAEGLGITRLELLPRAEG